MIGRISRRSAPKFWAYVLSFVFLGIYWNNHHHMFQVCKHVTGAILWANLHLLFWLSLVPFATAWLGETVVAPVPAALYGAVLLMAGAAYTILVRTIIASQGAHSPLKTAVGTDRKGWPRSSCMPSRSRSPSCSRGYPPRSTAASR